MIRMEREALLLEISSSARERNGRYSTVSLLVALGGAVRLFGCDGLGSLGKVGIVSRQTRGGVNVRLVSKVIRSIFRLI